MKRKLDFRTVEGICPECGEKCMVVPLLNEFDYAGTHCTHGLSGTHYPDDWGSPVSDCCEAYMDEDIDVDDENYSMERAMDEHEWRHP